MNCKHCGREIKSEDGRWYVHSDGGYRGKSRCNPEDSGLPYGYNAAPQGTACTSPCIGEGVGHE